MSMPMFEREINGEQADDLQIIPFSNLPDVSLERSRSVAQIRAPSPSGMDLDVEAR